MENNNNKVCPDDNLVWAILCTVLCCWPFGIVSIIKSTSVKNLWVQGHYDEAQKAAEDSKKWAKWGAISMGIFWAIYILILIICVIVGVSFINF